MAQSEDLSDNTHYKWPVLLGIIVYGVLLLPVGSCSLLVFGMSGDGDPLTIIETLFVYTLIALPLVLALTIALALVNYLQKKYAQAAKILLLPLFNAALLALLAPFVN